MISSTIWKNIVMERKTFKYKNMVKFAFLKTIR